MCAARDGVDRVLVQLDDALEETRHLGNEHLELFDLDEQSDGCVRIA